MNTTQVNIESKYIRRSTLSVCGSYFHPMNEWIQGRF